MVIFDNSVQNTKDAGGQLRALAFVLEHAPHGKMVLK